MQEKTDKKITITNVPPHVPYDEIIKLMNSHSVTIYSLTQVLRLTQEEGLMNILSEKWSINILADTADNLPTSKIRVISYDENEYPVFFTTMLK